LAFVPSLLILANFILPINAGVIIYNMSYSMNIGVQQKFSSYPDNVAVLLNRLRDIILNVAKQEGISNITETLKWGEPSYVSKVGSTIRIDWKAKYPDQYYIYFNCKTSLLETFKEVYGDTFTYEGSRAIVFKIDQVLPDKELAHCISMSLRYKQIKHLVLLGA